MSARMEHELFLENICKEKLKGMPGYVTEFYYYLSGQGKQPTTKKAYIEYVDHFLRYCSPNYKFNLEDISPIVIDEYMGSLVYKNRKKTSPSMRCTRLSAIKLFFNMLTTRGYISQNPTKDLIRPKSSKLKPVIYLSPEEISQVEKNICEGVGSQRAQSYQQSWKNRDLALVFIALSTGVRVESLVEIDIDDINLISGELTVIDKGEKRYVHELPEITLNHIKNWLKDRKKLLKGKRINALFISTRRDRLGTQGVRNLIKKYTYNIDKTITPHKLRSTFATTLYSETQDIYLVAEVIGHDNVNTTKRYAAIQSNARSKVKKIMQEKLG